VPKSQTVNPTELTRDERLRYRQADRMERVAVAYAEHMADYGGWGRFPPLTVLRLSEPFWWDTEESDGKKFGHLVPVKKEYPAGTLLLVGGFTRCRATDLLRNWPDTKRPAWLPTPPLCIDEAPAEIFNGTWEESHRLAWGENQHGAARSADEIELVLSAMHLRPEFRDAPERQVASCAGCSRAAVNRWREKARRWAEKTQSALPFADRDKFRPKLRDAWGREVPESLEPEFRSVAAARKAAERFRQAGKELLALKYDATGERVKEAGLARVDAREISALSLQLADRIDASLPFLVCPDCEGLGKLPVPQAGANGSPPRRCERCKGEGLLLRAAADDLPPESERKAREAAGATAA
jgi:hypothetical protein